MLVAALLHSITCASTPYGSIHDDESSSALLEDDSLARACIVSDSTAPLRSRYQRDRSASPTTSEMAFNVDFGSTVGFKSYAKKKKAAPATKFDPWGEDSKKEDTGANDTGGNDGAGGSGGDNGGTGGGNGGGDDNNNNGGDDDDAWGFSTGTKKKKKTKKQEEEEERKRKEEEEAKAAAESTGADPLSWADDANGEGGTEDWTMSWGGTKKKDKKSKVSYCLIS